MLGVTMRSEYTHRDAIEKIVFLGLVFLKDPNVLENLGFHLDTVVISNGVLSEEIEYNEVGRFERHVLTAEGAAADSISFLFAFLVSGTKR